MSFSNLYMEYLKKQRRKQNVVGKVFFFSALSAVAAASIALLTSPKSGVENRKQLNRLGKKVVKQAVEIEQTGEERFDELKVRAEKRFAELRTELSGRVDKLREKLGENIDDVEETGEKIAEDIKKKIAPKRVIKKKPQSK